MYLVTCPFLCRFPQNDNSKERGISEAFNGGRANAKSTAKKNVFLDRIEKRFERVTKYIIPFCEKKRTEFKNSIKLAL